MSRFPIALLLLGLVLSGVAGVLNQVLWQRALRIFLGGSETLSAMVVVVVFLGGLGAGAALAGRRAGALARPLRALALVELGLALSNLLVAGLLSLDLTSSVYAAQRFAVGAGLPLRAVYAVAAAALLAVPTLLMGATVPLAGAAAQRQLGARGDALVPALFVVNTAGAAVGAWSASAVLLPAIGQRASLLVALVGNVFAALVFAVAARGRGPAPPLPAAAPVPSPGGLRPAEWAGAALGFLSLCFEVLLLRALTLAYEPQPSTFAVSLAAYLVVWSLGVSLAGAVRPQRGPVAFATAALLLGVAPAHAALRAAGDTAPWLGAALLSAPCLGFGLLYGALARAAAADWGRDLGRFSAANTLGSCAGVVFFTLVGFEAPLVHGLGFLAAGVAAVGLALTRARPAAPALGALAAAVLGLGLATPTTTNDAGEVAWWGRDGVVELTPDGQVFIDGLWHTRLSRGGDHIGEPYAWLMAAAAVLGLDGRPLRRALVIGAGIGVSSVTLAGVEGVQVDGYEINRTLLRLLRAHPVGTLHSLDAPGVRWIWGDARTGLALDESRYDLILSAPLHLRAAGSSLLLSDEYLALAKSRLNPGGVLAVYANEGVEAQSLLVQRTLAEHFAHRVTWSDGLVTVASDAPFTLTEDRLRARMEAGDRFAEELWAFEVALRAEGGGGVWSLYEGAARAGLVADRPITDDHPLLEHPARAATTVQAVPLTTVRAAPR